MFPYGLVYPLFLLCIGMENGMRRGNAGWLIDHAAWTLEVFFNAR
jgi:hypothetical protein